MLLFFAFIRITCAIFAEVEKRLDYGDERKDIVVLYKLRQRKPQMDGTLSGVWGVEYDGRADCSHMVLNASRHGCVQMLRCGNFRQPGG